MAQSRDGGNPFAEPSELDNPFQDPAVIQHRPSRQYATLDVYNPFETREPPPAYEPPAPAPLPPPSAPSLQPSRKLSPTEPKNYGSYSTQASAAAATAELLKKQEELNRKAEELDRRERELQHAALGGTARHLHGDPPRISEDCIHHVLPLDVGWISALVVPKGNTAVSVLMLLVALLFTGIAVLGIVMLKRIHSLYRRTGASFQKAQQEFAAGVFSNPAVRTAAANAAAGAAENAFRAP
ncbi:secretory carrier membrane protein 3, isoform CRA_d [Homo sapiens]|nr:secretory carrier membrane protein 3, isoform CRA_d [Homo sapiens]